MDKDDKKIEEKDITEEVEEIESKENDETEELEKRISGLEKQIEEGRNAKLRALADYQNMRNRHMKEIDDMKSFSQTIVLLKVMDVIDDYRNLLDVTREK